MITAKEARELVYSSDYMRAWDETLEPMISKAIQCAIDDHQFSVTVEVDAKDKYIIRQSLQHYGYEVSTFSLDGKTKVMISW